MPAGRFDYQRLDETTGRLVITHMGADQVVVVGTATQQVVGTIAPLGAYFVACGSITVDTDGQTASNTYSSTIVTADGTILDNLTATNSTGRYVRIQVEPQSAVGQPLAGFPAWAPLGAATPTP